MQPSSRVLCAAFVLLAFLRPAVGEVFQLRTGGRVEGDWEPERRICFEGR